MPSPIYWLCALFLLSQCAYGSDVLLTSDPKVIQTILTQKMQMECKLNDSIHSDLQFVTSLLVSRNGKSLATITPFSPVQAYMDLDKLNVSGQVTTQNGAQGYLKLEWTYPDQGQSGNYTCDVNGVNSVGHPVLYTTSVYISSREPSLSDITVHVAEQQKIIDKHHAEGLRLKADSISHTYNIGILQSEMRQQQQEMAIVNKSAMVIETKMATVISMMEESRHVENGTVVCGDSSSWTDTGSYKETEVTTSFNATYGNPPVIHVSPNHISNYNDNSNYKSNVQYWVDVVDINQSNFTLRCKIYDSSYLRMYEMDVSWFSIGSYQ